MTKRAAFREADIARMVRGAKKGGASAIKIVAGDGTLIEISLEREHVHPMVSTGHQLSSSVPIEERFRVKI